MNFVKVIQDVTSQLDASNIRYALIGGFAMALHGVQRATIDLDFILMMEDLDRADSIFLKSGYKRAYRSENVSHYISDDLEMGRIDILHAFRGPSLGMLKRAKRIQLSENLSLPVVQIEDLTGLKVQAAVNDPQRALSDWADIQMMMNSAADSNNTVDWDLISDYLDIFEQSEKLKSLQEWYGKTDKE